MKQNIKSDVCLGENIRRARNKLGLTQDALVTKLQVHGCDISRGTYAKIEAGIRHITVQELKAIKEFLQMDYAEIFDDKEI